MGSQIAFRGAKRGLSGKEYKLLSFDVFDTCLIRDFVSQESLWYLVGREISSRLPGIPGPIEFVRLRGRADNEARSQVAAEDITLTDVYTRLALMCDWTPEQQRQAIAIEEEFELRGLRLNPAASDLLVRAQGAPVSYLSDTPHRGAFIRSCLDKQSLPAGEVLSSGDLGLRKGTGSLFREATKRFGVARDQILHIGNDLRADGAGSAAAGVAFAPLLSANPTRYEVTLDTATRETGGLLGAVLGGASRDFRLSDAGQSPTGLVSVVTGVAGPAILAAVAWTLLSAQRDGLDILYFVARDGEILLAVAQLLQQDLGLAPEIECRYLYGSRKAWYLPALSLESDMDRAAALRRLLLRSFAGTLRDLLAMVDIDVEAVAEAAPQSVMDVSPDAPLGDRGTAIIDALVSSPEFQSLAFERAKKAYEATVGYLAQEKMFSGGQVGLVDVGWRGVAAASLVSMAAAQGTDVLCYFAGGLSGPGSQAAPEDSRAFLIDTRGEESELDLPMVILTESFCAGSGGTTLGYTAADGRYLPRLAPADANPAMRWGLGDYQTLMRDYAASVCRSLAKFEWTITLDEVGAIRPYLMTNFRALWNYPSYEEADQWGRFPFSNEDSTGMLGRVITARDLADYPLRAFRSAEKGYGIGPWKRAAIARTLGGRRFTDPLGLLQVLSHPRGRSLRSKIRSKLALRPTVRLENVDVQNKKISVH